MIHYLMKGFTQRRLHAWGFLFTYVTSRTSAIEVPWLFASGRGSSLKSMLLGHVAVRRAACERPMRTKLCQNENHFLSFFRS